MATRISRPSSILRGVAAVAVAAALCACGTVESATRSAVLAPPRQKPVLPPAQKPPPAPQDPAARVQTEVLHKAHTDQETPPKADVESRQMFPIDCIDLARVPAPFILGGQPEHLMPTCYPVNQHPVGTTEHPR